MSYRVWLTIDTGGNEPYAITEELSIFSQLRPMWRETGIDLMDLDGQLAGACIMKVTEAVRQLDIEPARFAALTPITPGYGSYLNLSEFFEALLADLLAHPKATVQVSP